MLGRILRSPPTASGVPQTVGGLLVFSSEWLAASGPVGRYYSLTIGFRALTPGNRPLKTDVGLYLIAFTCDGL